jgi:anti-repressor protein
MFEYGFVENQDFNLIIFDEVRFEGNRQVKRQVQDYALTLDTAKEISMLQRNEKGKAARQYFIEVEKEYKKPKSQIEALLESVQMLADQERRLKSVETTQHQLTEAVEEIKAKQSTIATEYYSVSGWFGLHKRKLDLTLSQAIGRKCSKLSRDMGILIGKAYDAKYGQINTFHQDVLQSVAPMGVSIAIA